MKLAAGGLQLRSESLGIFEDVVRDGNGSCHTKGITAGVGALNQARDPEAGSWYGNEPSTR
jgi:hypothetical protein